MILYGIFKIKNDKYGSGTFFNSNDLNIIKNRLREMDSDYAKKEFLNVFPQELKGIASRAISPHEASRPDLSEIKLNPWFNDNLVKGSISSNHHRNLLLRELLHSARKQQAALPSIAVEDHRELLSRDHREENHSVHQHEHDPRESDVPAHRHGPDHHREEAHQSHRTKKVTSCLMSQGTGVADIPEPAQIEKDIRSAVVSAGELHRHRVRYLE